MLPGVDFLKRTASALSLEFKADYTIGGLDLFSDGQGYVFARSTFMFVKMSIFVISEPVRIRN